MPGARRADARRPMPGEVRVVEVDDRRRRRRSRRSLLFGYVAQFLYEGDSPLAERRAAALALDSGLLAELLGPGRAARAARRRRPRRSSSAELQRLVPDRHARDAEGAADLLRLLGPLTDADAAGARRRRRTGCGSWWPRAARSRVRIAGAGALGRGRGRRRGCATRSARRCRSGVPEAFPEPVADPLGDLVARYARTHGPFHAADAADAPRPRRRGRHRGAAAARGRRAGVVSGEFRPGGSGTEWCDAEVLRRLRRRSLAALRREVEPVPPRTLGPFLPAWQHVGGRLRGPDGRAARRRAAGRARWCRRRRWSRWCCRPGSRLHARRCSTSSPPPARSCGPAPGRCPAGRLGRRCYLADAAPLLLPEPDDRSTLRRPHARVLEALAGGGGLFFRAARRPGRAPTDEPRWPTRCGTWCGPGDVTNDTLAPLRALVGAGRSAAPARRVRPARPRRGRATAGRAPRARPGPVRRPPPGRWSLLPDRSSRPDPAGRAPSPTQLLDRHGVVTRGAVVAEGVAGGFAAVYRVLSAFEDAGRCRRGYVVEGLGRGPVRDARRGRPAAHVRRPTAPRRPHRARWCSPPPTRRTRTAPRCRGPPARRRRDRAPARAQGRRARRARRRRARALRRAGRAHAAVVGRRPRDARAPRCWSWRTRSRPAGWAGSPCTPPTASRCSYSGRLP